MLFMSTYSSPIGDFQLLSTKTKLKKIILQSEDSNLNPAPEIKMNMPSILEECMKQLSMYFGGTLRSFSIPVGPDGTSFQLRAWTYLSTIEYGETISYGTQARGIGIAKGARAVGSANALNPIPIILPCHRVIGSDGKLRGYGGGSDLLYIKEYLLAHEKKNN